MQIVSILSILKIIYLVEENQALEMKIYETENE